MSLVQLLYQGKGIFLFKLFIAEKKFGIRFITKFAREETLRLICYVYGKTTIATLEGDKNAEKEDSSTFWR